jgi:hypothetical protein
MVNYTTLTEKLDMEVHRVIMDRHFKSLMESEKNEGTADRLRGDGRVPLAGEYFESGWIRNAGVLRYSVPGFTCL